MALALDIASWALLLGGGLACIISGVGLLRLPDFYTRTHAGGIVDGFGATLLLLGLLLQAESFAVAIRLVFIIGLLLLTAPTACHALAQAALKDGLKPKLHKPAGTDAGDKR